jgi:hypothetical protein
MTLRSNDISNRIRLSWQHLIAVFALMMVTGEAHEQVHIQTGRFICGRYGPRDFNAWSTSADCVTPEYRFLATLAGPLFSYLVLWAGAYLLLRAASAAGQSLGFALVFAPVPFARIFTAVMGGGDEKVVLIALFSDTLSLSSTKLLAAILVTAICLPPILIAGLKLTNRFRWLYVVGFSVGPLIVLGFWVFKVLNVLLEDGFMDEVLLLGTPTLILVNFAAMAALLAVVGRFLLRMFQHETEPRSLSSADIMNGIVRK